MQLVSMSGLFIGKVDLIIARTLINIAYQFYASFYLRLEIGEKTILFPDFFKILKSGINVYL
jgi:hypothetical protein